MAAKKAKSKKALRKKVEPRKAARKKTPARKIVKRKAAASSAKPAKKTSRARATAKAKAKSKSPPKARRKPVVAAKSAPRAASKKASAPVAAATKKASAPVAAATKTNGFRRRDRAGHLEPHYAADLLAKGRESRDADDVQPAFVRGTRSGDGLAEELGEEAVETMTSGEDDGGDTRDQFVDEEIGGPFVESSAKREFAEGNDASNPDDATREPFPKT
jgi:hypothetical protein